MRRREVDQVVAELRLLVVGAVRVVERVVMDDDDLACVSRLGPKVGQDRADIRSDLLGEREQLGGARAIVGGFLLAHEHVVGPDHQRDEPDVRVRLQIGDRG